MVESHNHKPSICFVAHNAYGALSGSGPGQVGGIQHQQALMAKWLARRGYRVSMLTWDAYPTPKEVIEGVHVIPVCHHDAGFPGLRFFHPRWTGLARAMRRADADVYYQNCGEYVTGQVALWCRRHGRKFVYSVANDPDCDPRLPEMRTIRERILYRYGLRHADRVIAQTHVQQRMLWDGFGIKSTVIPMPCQGPSDTEYRAPVNRRSPSARLLWVGRVCAQKRPDRLLDIATECPQLVFDLVGPFFSTPYSQAIRERAERLTNVVVHGAVSRDLMPPLYQRAACLLCTSDFEGFPNTFLEAWSHGIPVITTFDPDGIIAAHGMGIVSTDTTSLLSAIRLLLSKPSFWASCSMACRQYYSQHHAIDKTMPLFAQAFEQLAR